MARRNVKINLPINQVEEFVKVCKAFLKKHKEMGATSPLAGIDMTSLEARLLEADTKREESKELRGKSEARMQEAMSSLGINKGQTADTPGTVYSLITQGRDILLGLNKGKEENLNDWGLPVVISTSSATNRQKKEK